MRPIPPAVDPATLHREAPVEVGELAALLAMRSIGYGILSLLAAMTFILLASVTGLEALKRQGFLPVAAVLWLIGQYDVLRRLRRSARAGVTLRNSAHAIHRLELCIAGFLLLYALARPYLIDADASAYPYVERLFQLLLGCVALWHLLVLGIFRCRPGLWDAASLLVSAGIALGILLR
jgi:hypothetical protein